MKKWLETANGFQRIWFVASIIILIFTSIVFPLHEVNRETPYKINQVESAIKNPTCEKYVSSKVDDLKEPSDEMLECADLWYYRHFRDPEGLPPFTIEKYQRHLNLAYWSRLCTYSLIGLGISISLSLLLYVSGLVVLWVYRGFTPKNKL